MRLPVFYFSWRVCPFNLNFVYHSNVTTKSVPSTVTVTSQSVSVRFNSVSARSVNSHWRVVLYSSHPKASSIATRHCLRFMRLPVLSFWINNAAVEGIASLFCYGEDGPITIGDVGCVLLPKPQSRH